jgi:hypothetical protein
VARERQNGDAARCDRVTRAMQLALARALLIPSDQ